MNSSIYGFVAIAALLTLVPPAVAEAADNGPVPNTTDPHFQILPEYVEYTATNSQGDAIDLQCAWVIGPDGTSRLGDYHRYNEVNIQKDSGKRFWTLGSSLVTVNAKTLGDGAPPIIPVVTEVFTAAGQDVTKSCTLHLEDDSYRECAPQPSFTARDAARAFDDKISEWCHDLFTKSYQKSIIPTGFMVNTPSYKDPKWKSPIRDQLFYTQITDKLHALTSGD